MEFQTGEAMINSFEVGHLELERLLWEWRWLGAPRMTLIARSSFGDLFLRAESGAIFWLNITIGKLTEIVPSEAEFRELAKTIEKRKEWFAEPDVLGFAERGLNPTSSECIGFKVPLVFAESASPNNAYIADVYQYVSFMGDLNRQLSSLPDGAKIKLQVAPPPQLRPTSRS